MSGSGQYPTFASGDLPTMGRAPGAGMRVLGGRFELVRPLGRGGMGMVWLARDGNLEGAEVALKFLPETMVGDAGARVDLRREAMKALRLSHPHVVRVYDYFEDDRSAGISMEYVDGPTLSGVRVARPGGVLEVDEIAAWIGQLCEALAYAHGEGIVHRDLKPANLMMDGRGRLRVCDFGIARAMSDSMTRLTGRADASGTLPYMSPQQLLGKKATPADDVYALGATVYELLTGKPPFHSGSIERQIEGVVAPPMAERREELEVSGASIPAVWERVVAFCLAKEAADRPGSAAEVWESLRGGEMVERPGVSRGTAPVPVAGQRVASGRPISVRGAVVAVPRAGADGDGTLAGQEMVNGIWMRLCWCPAGRFVMASPRNEPGRYDNEEQVEVELTGGFWMGKYQVTQGEYDFVMKAVGTPRGGLLGRVFSAKKDANPSHFKGNARLPVENVSWEDAVEFCRVLTEMERASGKLPGGWEYALPTEAQWEYACRAGTTGPWAGDLDAMGWYSANSGGRTHEVGKKRANGWGLHDMHGNVWEWCADWYEGRLEGGADPMGPPKGSDRVIRGGGWYYDARCCRSAGRDGRGPGYRSSSLGFRVALRSIRP